MKKLGLIKRIGLTATTLFVCLAMLITCFTFTAPRAVLAEGENEPATPTTSDPIKVAENVKVKDTYNYGEKIKVPAGATVIAPDGKPATVTAGEVEATQLGVYKISYTEDNVTYDFKVSVKLAEEYFLYIEYNGADIPTYVEKGSSFTLPEAYVMYYDKNNILQDYPGKDYTVEIEDSWGNTYNGETKTFNPNQDGKVFITYTATLGKTAGTKRLTKTFTVNVQSSVNKSGNPSLAVSGIAKDASVNRPVTLPVAKVSDTNDDNIKVVIEVLDPKGEKVKNVKVNDDGYAYETKDDEVKFDNDKSMTFYPTETGKYKVRYTAYNDFGGKSSTSESIIEVADHVAPVFKNTDKYEYLIPETWGMSVKDESGATVEGGKIKFLIPEVVDNKCHVPANADDKDNLISIYFRVTDSDNNKTILTIPNILSTGDDGKFEKNDVYKEDATFNNEEKAFTFDFSQYNKKDSKDKDKDAPKPGTYTVLFRARDKDNNTSSKTYTITLKDTYEDKAKPSEAKVTAPEYISAADESFTIPYPVYADAEDTRPYVVYRLYTDAETKDNYIDVKGGEEASLTAKAGYIVVNEGKENEKELKLGDNLYFYLGVTDKAGNFRSNAVAEDKSFVNVAEAEEITEDTLKAIAAVTKVIPETTSEKTFDYDGNIQFVKVGGDENTPIYAGKGDVVNAGSFVITAANEDMRYYTGFEVAVYDPEGDYVDVTLETLSDVKDGEAKIYVQNIRFTPIVPTKADDENSAYVMTVRVFDVNGNNTVYGYKLTGVNATDDDSTTTSAVANVPFNGDVNVKYKLKNSVITHITGSGTYRTVRKISGGIFSLMGNEFTAKTAGGFDIQDGYINANKIEETGFNYSDVEFNIEGQGNYSVNVVDDSSPVIELQGKMPTYKAKYDADKGEYSEANGLVKIPTAVAYTENGMGEVKIDVKKPDGKDAEMVDDYTFKADQDGTYTVTYTGTYANGGKDEAQYFISVGDVFAPKFTLTGGTSTASSKKQGDTFKFKTMELVAGEDSDGVEITKEIALGTDVISGTTVSGSYSGYYNKANNGSEIKLDKAGTYTITYTAKDRVGNDYKITETLTVSSEGSSTATTWTTLSTVLIVVAIVLLAGVVIYVVRFRKVKK